MSYIDDLKRWARIIKDFCSESYDNEESCPFFRGYKEEDGVKIVICELNKGHCSPCNWELDKWGIHYNSNLCSTAICIDCCGCEQYNQALDDFVNKCEEVWLKAEEYIPSLDIFDIKKIEEQLKR